MARREQVAEKGFSLGFFDEHYIARCPLALIERNGRMQAFANVWAGARRVEVSVDLMRHRTSAPNGVMDALFTALMQWGKDEGYEWFNLGMAPLSGLEDSPVAPLWAKLGRFVYGHGKPSTTSRGYAPTKRSSIPSGSPATSHIPAGLALPRILADVSALIAGGYRKIFLKS